MGGQKSAMPIYTSGGTGHRCAGGESKTLYINSVLFPRRKALQGCRSCPSFPHPHGVVLSTQSPYRQIAWKLYLANRWLNKETKITLNVKKNQPKNILNISAVHLP
ncbi:AT-rich interactive domain-containing protein 1B [Platysternon megacephalum]|uniref:AT-rich interactive domain-containing protein 1B n=1 Tax=Platysternon megacephalum TaxID=55544 RepID=A0A4D9EED5_9SAUR|nr:AT-rich interactive domain-containing protein 1B [Platysternon megacephalum]